MVDDERKRLNQWWNRKIRAHGRGGARAEGTRTADSLRDGGDDFSTSLLGDSLAPLSTSDPRVFFRWTSSENESPRSSERAFNFREPAEKHPIENFWSWKRSLRERSEPWLAPEDPPSASEIGKKSRERGGCYGGIEGVPPIRSWPFAQRTGTSRERGSARPKIFFLERERARVRREKESV